ncbi:MAG: hypothetical protein FWH23_03490 [Bacteroidales bacterium]|nr:hypothetical protein [Bacteroidales bacterium]MCL2132743.1 hypothetical protein [Bacteroidales bacterium]
MNQSKKQYLPLILSLLATVVIAGLAGWIVLYWIFPAYYFRWYPLIPAYFILLGLFMSIGMYHYSRHKAQKILTAYMLSRAIKIVLTLGSVLLYYWLAGENITEMVITTLIFYFLYLFVEIAIFYRFEKMTRQIR